MLVGIVGAPNKGKSTIFSALTLNEVAIADYPFTTINPNLGVAYATKECIEKSLSVKCKARNSLCINGTRMLPVNVIDVAGLVEGAHAGKGMGNQFLNDLASSEALLLVVDASGKTDSNGNSCDDCNPANDVRIVTNELLEWLTSIIKRHVNTISKRKDGVNALGEVLAGLKVTKEQIKTAIDSCFLTDSNINWSDSDIKKFSSYLIEKTKPILIVANKSDLKNSEQNIKQLKTEYAGSNVIECSGAIELALRKAAKQKIIDYTPGSREFNLIKKDISDDQSRALEFMLNFVRSKGTNVQQVINKTIFELLDNIVVYPVEDENKYTDHFGNVLPDAILIKRGSTAVHLASAIHTDLAQNMLYAVDAKTKRRLGKDYILKDNDVIKIVSTAKQK